MDFKIHFLQPFSYELNIGGAYNEAVKLIPEKDFICITDQDTLKFPRFAHNVKSILENHKNPYRVAITCQTNRLGKPNAQIINSMYNDDSILNHQSMGAYLWERHQHRTSRIDKVAGVCLIFSKEVWARVGGFREHSITFDNGFSKDCKRAGIGLEIALGLYILHLYRYGTTDPKNETGHLRK